MSVNLPTSTALPDRYKPEGSEITYLIQIPDRIAKARYRRSMKALSARIWPKSSMIESARATLEEAQLPDLSALSEIIDRYEQLTEDAPKEEQKQVVGAWADLARILHSAGGDFAARIADNEFWMELAPLISARCFLLGVEGQDPLRRGPDGILPDATLSVIDEEHIPLIGYRALSLFEPSETQVKNSASPQQ